MTVSGCAGSTAETTKARRGVGHGSVEEVSAALTLERLPCADPKSLPLGGFEQVLSCRIGTEQITIVHFFDVAQAKKYEADLRAAGEHGVFADTWAAKVPSARLAKRIGTTIDSSSYV